MIGRKQGYQNGMNERKDSRQESRIDIPGRTGHNGV